MNQIFRNSLFLASLALLPGAARGDDSKVLYKDLVQPILNAKCVACHGPDKQKGKLRLDTLEEVLGGSDGENVIPGKIDDSLMTFRVTLPLDDVDIMPPEDEPQLTKEEIEVLKFWVASGAKGDAKIGDLKPSGDAANAIKVVLANPPKAPQGIGSAAPKKEIDPAKQKLAEETIGRVEKDGASLMAIAQDTPDLRFSALNVAKEYGDKNLELLKPVADQVKWMDLARTQVTDAGLANLAGMKNLSRLHLENTKITDAGLDHLKGLANLEYLNLYGTQVTDAGIQKLAGLKNLKKLFVWQTKVTDAGAQKLIAAVPGIDVNTGWKEPAAKPVELAANTAEKSQPAGPTAAAKKEEPAKPAPAPAKKEQPAKPAPAPAKKEEPAKPKPTPTPTPAKKEEPAKPAPAPAKKEEPAKPAAATSSITDLGDAIAKALNEAKAASAGAKSIADSAKSASDNAGKVATDAQKAAADAKAASTAAKTASDEAKKVAGDANTASTAAKQAAEGATKTAGAANTAAANAVKVANDAKAAADGAQKTAAEAQKAAAAAQQAAADAQKAAAEANRVAAEAKTLLMELQKAAAAIVGAVE